MTFLLRITLFNYFSPFKPAVSERQSRQHKKIEGGGGYKTAKDYYCHRPLDLSAGGSAADGQWKQA